MNPKYNHPALGNMRLRVSCWLAFYSQGCFITYSLSGLRSIL